MEGRAWILRQILCIACLTCCSLVGTSASVSDESEDRENPCPEGVIVVVDQPGAPVQLTVSKPVCTGSTWRAVLTVTNTSALGIIDYEIGHTEDYEHKACSKGSTGGGGDALRPGATLEIPLGAGFPSGMSYGQPTGDVVRVAFQVLEIKFEDGTRWATDGADLWWKDCSSGQ
jgi:hypothetical protein